MSVQIRKLHSCLGQILFYCNCAVHAACQCSSFSCACTAATSSHSLSSFHCIFPCCIFSWFAVWRGSHLTLSALLSHSHPGCQVLHWQAVMMVSTTAKGGRRWTGNEWIGFNTSRGLLNTCVAVWHSWVVNPSGSWKNEDFSFLEVIVGLLSNTSFQFQ